MTNLCSSLFLCPKKRKIREAETAVDKEWENLTKVQRSSCTPKFVKDDSVSYAIFTEQGPSASLQKYWISYQDCQDAQDKQRTQYLRIPRSKMEDAPQLLNIPKSECPDIWIRQPRHKWPKSWSSMEDPVVPLERNLYGHPLAGLLWERQFEKILLQHVRKKLRIGNAYSLTEKRTILVFACGRYQTWWKENRTLIRLGKSS